MPIILRFKQSSTLDNLPSGQVDGYFAVDRDGYAFHKSSTIPGNDVVLAVYATKIEAEDAVRALGQTGIDMRILCIAVRDAYSGEHIMSHSNICDRPGIDPLGIPKARLIQDEAALKPGNFLLVVQDEIIDVEKAKEILRNTQPKAVAE